MRRVAACLLVLAVALAAPVAAGASPGASGGADASAATTANASANDSNGTNFGTELSGFMASTAANTESDVDQGVWRAGVNASDATRARGALDRRARTLRERLHRLEARRAELSNRSGPRTIGDDVRLAETNARIRALAAAVNDTASVAPGRETDNVTALRREVADAKRRAPGRGRAPPWAALGSGASEHPARDNRTPGGAGENATPGHAAVTPSEPTTRRPGPASGSNAPHRRPPSNGTHANAAASPSGSNGTHANAAASPSGSNGTHTNAAPSPSGSNASGDRSTSPRPNGTAGNGPGAPGAEHPRGDGAGHRGHGPQAGV